LYPNSTQQLVQAKSRENAWGVDEKGRVRLSRKAAMEDRDKEAAGKEAVATEAK
jgi:hypothetical protein